MKTILLKSKIHRARITEANLYYEGSLTIDAEIMEKAGVLPYEKVSVVNINNGERFETYAIEGERGKKDFCLNGAAARKGSPGDEIIVMTYGLYDEKEAETHKPTIVLLDKDNEIQKIYQETLPRNKSNGN